MRALLFGIFLLGTTIQGFSQFVSNSPTPKRGEEKVAQKSTKPLNEIVNQKSSPYKVTHQHTSKVSGVTHIYLRQAIGGIEVMGTDSSIHIDANGNVVASHNNFIENIESTVSQNSARLNQEAAILSVASKMGYNVSELVQLNNKGGVNQEMTFNKAGISTADIPVKLMYLYSENEGTKLVWELSIQEGDSSDWWVFRVDASNGAIVSQENLTISCFGEDHNHDHDIIEKIETNEPKYFYTVENEPSSNMMVGTYEVFPMPYESPGHSPNANVLISVANPDNATASPYGWHDTNGSPGSEFTRTQGNNCSAYDDDNNTNSASTAADYAEGGGSLNFTGFSYSPTYSAGNQSEDAAVTNLFYWTNIIHDVVYQYGFDEASGNFQENNYGNGGTGSDSVNSEAQDGSGTCNANFATPTEGFNPRMQMYTCGSRDGDFDNGVIIHEYGHGISTRLTGGAANSSCLNNTEQMGEGWSDYYGLMMTMETGDAATDSRGIGTWLIGEAPTGGGIRTYPYSTNFAVNPHTYDDIKTEAVPHGVGSVWCAMLWEMTWELIGDHGFSTDFYTFTGNAAVDAGNVQALALVTEALKLQPCSPGFVDGRDAILLADQNIYGGANQCAIWDAFARRGLGFSADQGSSGSRSDGTEAFDLPPGTAQFNNSVSDVCITDGVQTGLTGGSPVNGVYSGVGVTDDGNGTTYTFDPSVAGVGTTTVTYTVTDSCTGGVVNLDQTIEVKDGTPDIICQDITLTLDATGNVVLDPFANQATLVGGNNNSGNAGFSALVMTPTSDVSISFDWNYSTTDDPAYDSFGYILGTTYFAISAASGNPQSGTFSIDLAAGTQFGFCTYTADNQFGAATGVVTNFSPGFIGQFAAANFTEVQQESDGSATIDLVNALGIIDSCSTTSFSGQTAFTCQDVGTNTVTFTVTDNSSSLSTTCVSTVTILPNAAQLTTFSGGTWDNSAPTATSIAVFNDDYDTTANGDVDACSCTINLGNTVTVQGGDYMNIQGNINVNGTLIVEHEANVVQVDSDAEVTNNGTINVNVTSPILRKRDLMIMGSPMTAETRTGVWNSSFLVLDFTPQNFLPHPSVPSGGTNFADDDGDWYNPYTGGTLNPGEAFVNRPQSGYNDPTVPPAGRTFDFTYELGTLNNGDITYTNYNNGPTANPNGTPNMVANPYACAIDADEFMTVNPGVGALYFWEHLTPPGTPLPVSNLRYDMDDFSIYNGTMGIPAANDPGNTQGTAPNGIISTAQGFGIRTNGTAGTTGTITFNNDMRLTTGNNTLRNPQGAINTTGIDKLLLEVRDQDYGYGSFTGIAFDENATDGYDEGKDTNRLATIVSLYSHLDDGTEEFAIQTRGIFENGKKIPLGFSSQIDETIEYEISLTSIDGVSLSDTTTVYLYDHQENIITNLENDTYTFKSGMGVFNNRFTLLFKAERALGVGDTTIDTISVFPNPTKGQVTIISPNSAIENVTVFDMQGRVVTSKEVMSTSMNLDITNMQSSVYFIKITTQQGTITKRIVKN